MGLYTRPNSPYYWMNVERPGQSCLRLSTGVPVNGGTIQQGRENERLAQAIYAAAKGDIARGVFGLKSTKPAIAFAEFRAWYENTVVPTRRNQKRDRSMLKQLGRFFDPLLLTEITREKVAEWQLQRLKEVSAGTVNRELQRLKSLLRAAVPKYLDASPLIGLEELGTDEGEPRILEHDEEERLLKAASTEEHALIVCALDTLQRLSTVVALERAQDHGRYLTVLRPKGRGKRIPYQVPVSTRLRKALDALPTNGARFFPAYGIDRDVAAKRVRDGLMALCERAGVVYGREAGGITFHSLRHTGASRMLNRGVDLKTVAEIGNWKDVTVLQRYLHPLGDARERAVEAVSDVPTMHTARKPARKSRKRRR